MSNPFKILFILTLSWWLSSCKMVYDPKLDESEEVLIVEALLTNWPGENYVKLSQTVSYESESEIPVKRALVSITDSTGNRTFLLNEIRSGYYTIPADSMLCGIEGHSYTLNIVTGDGKIYRSSPEVLKRTSFIEAIYGIKEQRKTLTENFNGAYIYKDDSFLDVLADVQGFGLNWPRIRFKTNLLYEMIDYRKGCIGYCPPIFKWQFNESDVLTITEPPDDPTLIGQLAGSYLMDFFTMMYYEKDLEYIVMELNSYHLNEDSYSYYTEVKKQLTADNALFDPITTQLGGNIVCVNNPEIPVTGLFEVSYHERSIFMVTPDPPAIKPVMNFRGLPVIPEGQQEGVPPEWWIIQ